MDAPVAKRCAYLSMDSMADFVSDADQSVAPMQSMGWHVEFVSWRDKSVDWNDWDMVYICTPWDYSEDVDAFLSVLDDIDASSALLLNDVKTVRWNLEKTYLRELADNGVAIVPSLWFDRYEDGFLEHCRDELDVDKLVIKPVIGANAIHTWVVDADVDASVIADIGETFRSRPFFVQPYLDAINTEGEYSLLFMGNEFSHALLKKPKSGDFRSQEEYGALILPAEAPAKLIAQAASVISGLDPEVAYARADFVADSDGHYLLMELELIEPSMYFRTNEASTRRFAEAMTRRYEKETC